MQRGQPSLGLLKIKLLSEQNLTRLLEGLNAWRKNLEPPRVGFIEMLGINQHLCGVVKEDDYLYSYNSASGLT